jgi:hypothetical protein
MTTITLQSRQSLTYSSDVLPLMQSLLSTLADIDFGHQYELEKLDRSSSDARTKRQIRNRLIAEHQQRRAPYVSQLGRFREAHLGATYRDRTANYVHSP